MDRLHQVRLELRAAETRGETSTFRLFAASAWILVGVAAVGTGILAFELLPFRDAGLALAVAALGGWPLFRLGRRHARRD
jgi:hypothetical protein